MFIARRLSDGSPDTDFDDDGYMTHAFAPGTATDMALTVHAVRDGSIFVTGASALSADFDAIVAKVTEDGDLDTTWGSSAGYTATDFGGTDDRWWSGAVDETTGMFYANGTTRDGAWNYVGTTYGDSVVARFHPDGTPDLSWGPGGEAVWSLDVWEQTSTMSVSDTGEVWVTGWAAPSYGGAERGYVAKLDALGAGDPLFDGDGIYEFDYGSANDALRSQVPLADGGVVAVGFSVEGADRNTAFLRLDDTGSPVAEFDGDGVLTVNAAPGLSETPRDLIDAGDGSILAVGYADNGSDSDMYGVRLEGAQVADFLDTSDDWDDGTQTFGACLHALAGGATADVDTWALGATCIASDAQPWNAVDATGAGPTAKVAESTTPGTTSAQVGLRFGFRTASDQAAGAYWAPITFEAFAPNT